MRKRIQAGCNILAGCIFLLVLSGCGQKGDLYLPVEPDAQNSNTEKSETTRSQTEKEKKQ